MTYNLGTVVGKDGNGIKSIEKTDTVGLTDIYTITFDDDTTTTFTVTNGEDGSGVSIVTSWESTLSDEKVASEKLVKDTLDTKAASTHTHGNITNDGKIGSTSGKPLITTTNGAITTGAFGTSAGDFAEGNHTHSGMLTTSDIVDNLTTNDASKVLSAKQGKALNDLIGNAIAYINQ